MIRIEMDFPKAGWSYLTVRGEQKHIRCRISYLSDGIGDLIRAFHRTLINHRASVAELAGEGFQSLVVLHVSGICVNDPVELCVLSGLVERDYFSQPLPDLSDREAKFFVAERKAFGKEVVRAIDAMLMGRSYREYYDCWACPPGDEDIHDPDDVDAHLRWKTMRFPELEFEELKQCFRE